MTTASDRRAIYAARDEVYDPQPPDGILVVKDAEYEAMMRSAWRVPGSGYIDVVHRDPALFVVPADADFEVKDCSFCDAEPIETEPADLDDTKRSTEAGAGFIVAVVVSALAICAGLFLAGVRGWL